MEPKHHECMCYVPLRQFTPGQKLCVKIRTDQSGFYVNLNATFVRIERGLVVVKYFPGWTPTWYDEGTMARRFPEGLVKVRYTSCYLWGKGRNDLSDRCHWFRTMDDPVEDPPESYKPFELTNTPPTAMLPP
jgi:hypothetical protein